ncbi:hypothetical protein [Streptomyces sp. NPDC006997]|uniref:hypothetical protein n=1 Tax=Streptomyces sp. NPDC006997 TaxID=3155356 RepID=UPI0033DBA494
MADANPRPEERGGDRPSLVQRVRARRRARRMLRREHAPERGPGQALLDVLRQLWRRLRGRGRGGDGSPASAAPAAGNAYGNRSGAAPRESRRERRNNEEFADLGTRMLALGGVERELFEDAVLRELMRHKKKDTALWKEFQAGRMPVAAMYANNAYGRELLRAKANESGDRGRLRKDAADRPDPAEPSRRDAAPTLLPLDPGPAFHQGGEVDKALDAARTRAATDFERGPQPVSRSNSTASGTPTRPSTPAVGDPALVSPLSTFATPVSPVSDRAGLASPLGNSAAPPSPSHSRPSTATTRRPAPARQRKGK